MDSLPLYLFLGSDHGGFALKAQILAHLAKIYPQINVEDLGPFSDESVDYPDFGQKTAQKVVSVPNSQGILICGTGIGMSISANRFRGIRAAVVHSDFTAQMAKEHNNANILCLGARTADPEDALQWIDIWLQSSFQAGRHLQRITKLDAYGT